jgi:predicted enzyme related to lactoylglutathione lyase
MHKSRLAGFIIDCNTDNLEQAAAFWSGALGHPLKDVVYETSAIYRQIETGPDGLHIEVQQVQHESRVHLDIEADDIEAEVKRLEGLGAKRVKQIRTWWAARLFCKKCKYVEIARYDTADALCKRIHLTISCVIPAAENAGLEGIARKAVVE